MDGQEERRMDVPGVSQVPSEELAAVSTQWVEPSGTGLIVVSNCEKWPLSLVSYTKISTNKQHKLFNYSGFSFSLVGKQHEPPFFFFLFKFLRDNNDTLEPLRTMRVLRGSCGSAGSCTRAKLPAVQGVIPRCSPRAAPSFTEHWRHRQYPGCTLAGLGGADGSSLKPKHRVGGGRWGGLSQL